MDGVVAAQPVPLGKVHCSVGDGGGDGHAAIATLPCPAESADRARRFSARQLTCARFPGHGCNQFRSGQTDGVQSVTTGGIDEGRDPGATDLLRVALYEGARVQVVGRYA